MRILHTEASQGWGGQEIRILREAEGIEGKRASGLFCNSSGSQAGELCI